SAANPRYRQIATGETLFRPVGRSAARLGSGLREEDANRAAWIAAEAAPTKGTKKGHKGHKGQVHRCCASDLVATTYACCATIRRRAARTPSKAKIASPAQMKAKPAARSTPNASPKKNTPSSSCSVGPGYCSRPTTLTGTRRTPYAEKTSGISASPPPSPRTTCARPPQPSEKKPQVPPSSIQASSASAGTNMNMFSTPSPRTASTAANLRITPYSAKEPARHSAIHGKRP